MTTKTLITSAANLALSRSASAAVTNVSNYTNQNPNVPNGAVLKSININGVGDNTTLLQSQSVPYYNSNLTYSVGQSVMYNGIVYQCIASSLNNLPTNTTYFTPTSSVQTALTTWTGSTVGTVGSLYTYNGLNYVCIAAASAGIAVTNTGNYTPFSTNSTNWTTSGTYTAGQIVTYNGVNYTCISGTTAGIPVTNTTYFTQNINPPVMVWASNTPYLVGQLINYNNIVYVCISAAPAGTVATNTTNFTPVYQLQQFMIWNGTTSFIAGQQFTSAGTNYVCILSAPAGTAVTNTTYFTQITQIATLPVWSSTVAYTTGQQFTSAGTNYVCILSAAANTSVSNTTYFNTVANVAQSTLPLWVSGTSYTLGTQVVYGGVTYQCISATSTALITNTNNWIPVSPAQLLQQWNSTAAYSVGQQVTYNGLNYVVVQAVGSSSGLQLSNTAYYLPLTGTLTSDWSYFGTDSMIFAHAHSSTSSGFGVPYPVKLSSANGVDTIINFSLPHFNHIGATLDYMGGAVLHAQVCQNQNVQTFNTYTLYTVGNLVSYQGNTYQCILNSNTYALPTNTLYWTQISLSPGATSRYANSAISNIPLPAGIFTSNTFSLWDTTATLAGGSYGTATQTNFKAIALSPTMVVIAIRQGTKFWLIRVPMLYNTNGTPYVDIANVSSLDLTNTQTGGGVAYGTTDSAFDICALPSDSTKVVVGGIVSTTFNITVYNVGTSNGSAYSMTAAGNTFTGLGITPGTAATAAMTNLSKFSSTSSNTGTSVFLAAVATAAGSFSAQLFSIVGSATTSGVTISLTGTASAFTTQGTIYSLGCTCLSSDTTANAAFYSTGATSATTLYIWQQTSLTAVSTTNTSTMTIQNSATVHGINRTLQWGDNRAVIIGVSNLLAVLSSPNNSTTITSTTMIPATESTNTSTSVLPQWFPFDTRPLYTIYDQSSTVPQRVSQFYSRSALANPVTDVGTLTYTGNYFTYGHEYTQTSGWSDVANCWIAGLGGRIYALDAYGNILSEVSLYKLYGASWNYIQSIRKLAVTTSGRIIAVGSQYYGTECNSYNTQANTVWSSYPSNALLILGTTVLSNPQQLSILGNTIATSVSAFIANSLTFASTDNTGTSETLYLTAVTAVVTPGVVIFKIVSTVSSVTQSYITLAPIATAGPWNVGPRCNIVLIHDFVQGQYRLVGANGTSTLLNTGYLYITNTPYIETSFASLSLGFPLSAGTPTGYALTFKSSPTLTTVALFDPTLSQGRIFHSAYGRAMQDWHTGYITNVSGNARYAIIGASKYANAISFANTGTTVPSTASNVYVFDSITLDLPKQITNGYISSVSWCNIRQTGKVTLQVNGMGVDQQNTMSGPSDTAKVFIELFDGTNTFTIGTPGGQPISTSGQLRTVEQYLIPYGYQLRLYTDTPNSVSTLVSVVEE